MEDILKKIEDLRNSLLDAYVENDQGNSLETFMKMDDVTPELKEALIMLHSMNKAELQAIRNHNFRNINELLNTKYAYVNEVDKRISEIERLVDEVIDSKPKDSKFKFFTTNKVILYAAFGLFVFFSIWLMATTDKDAVVVAHEVIKDSFNFKDK